MSQPAPTRLANLVAHALLSGPLQPEAVIAVFAQLGGGTTLSQRALAIAILRRFGAGRRPRTQAVANFLDQHRVFARAFDATDTPSLDATRATMQPAGGAPSTWSLPKLTTPGQLANWLQLSTDELFAFARHWRGDRTRIDARLLHYHRHWVPRRGAPPRLLEAPKARLKLMQRRLLDGLLQHIPPHDAAHGFVRGRSVRSFVAPHTGRHCVLRMDVQDFFASIGHARVVRVFLSAGYPEFVATLLADVCTTVTPNAAITSGLADHPPENTGPLRERLRRRHLPQGAPTSPALANLCVFHLDARLAGLAKRFEADYTRYADDLVFSGDAAFARVANRLAVQVGAILLDEGFTPAHRKTRRMATGTAQVAGGLVLNAHAAVRRGERKQLEATLVNCVRHGPSTQNRGGLPDFRTHLQGRIAHVAHVQAIVGAKLQSVFDRIVW